MHFCKRSYTVNFRHLTYIPTKKILKFKKKAYTDRRKDNKVAALYIFTSCLEWTGNLKINRV